MKNTLELLLEHDRLCISLSEIQSQLYITANSHAVINEKYKKEYRNGERIVKCEVDYWLDDGDQAWLVNSVEAIGHENMIFEVLKQLYS